MLVNVHRSKRGKTANARDFHPLRCPETVGSDVPINRDTIGALKAFLSPKARKALKVKNRLKAKQRKSAGG